MAKNDGNSETGVIAAIQTEYNGIRFRSRLEARWALFFDVMGIEWRYESEGYQLPSGWYVPDFYLPSCATFVEVRGDGNRVDLADLQTKASELPKLEPQGGERGPRLVLVGPMPRPPAEGDWTWESFDPDGMGGRVGFGTFNKNKRPWWSPYDEDDPLLPAHDPYEWDDAHPAYQSAYTRRFWNPA